MDIGPGAGEHGGQLIAQGTAQEIMACPESITGAYLSGRRSIPVPLHRKTRRYRKASIADAKRTAQVVKEHRAIYEAIAAGDADAAAALTTEHTIHAKKSMIERMDLHG